MEKFVCVFSATASAESPDSTLTAMLAEYTLEKKKKIKNTAPAKKAISELC